MRRLGPEAKTAIGIALATWILHGTLFLLCFPAGRQFDKYTHAALQHLAGTLPAERLLDLSPLYFYLNLLQNAFAPGGADLLPWLQILLTGFSAALLFLLLRRFFPPLLSLAGSVAFLASRSVLSYTAILEPEACLLFLLLASVFCLLREGRGYRLAGGVFFALCLLARPNFLPLLPVVPLFFRLNAGRGRWLAPALLFILPGVVALLLLAGRNASIHGVFSPVVMNPGFVFFEGNNPLSSGQSAAYPPLVGELKTEILGTPDNPHVTYRMLARRDTGRELSTAEANGYWFGRALNFISDHPERWMQLLATKAYFLLHDFRRYDLPIAWLYDLQLRQRWIPALPFSLVSALALVGLCASAREWRRRLLFYALFISQAGVMLAIYVSDRQRVAMLPFFIFFACSGAELLQRARRWRRAALLTLVAGGALWLYLPCDLMRDDLYLWQGYEDSDRYWVAAVEARQRGDLRLAADSAARSFAAAPWLEDYSRPAYLPLAPQGLAGRALVLREARGESSFSARFDRGVLLLAAGRLDAAETLFRELQTQGHRFERAYLQSSQPAFFLARIAAIRGETAAAVELLRGALAERPGDPFVLAQLASLTGEASYRQSLIRYYGGIETAFMEGRALLEAGRGGEAAGRLEAFAAAVPELRRGVIYLAAARAASGDLERGAQLYLEATRERSDPVLLEPQVLSLFKTRAEGAPGNPRLRHEYGLVLAQFGYFAEALREQQAAEALAPGRPVRDAIAWLQQLLRRQAMHEN